METSFEAIDINEMRSDESAHVQAKVKRLSYSSDDEGESGNSVTPPCRGLRAKRLFSASTPIPAGSLQHKLTGTVPQTPGPVSRIRPRILTRLPANPFAARTQQKLPDANINPFTPQGQRRNSKSKRYLARTWRAVESDDSDEDQPPKKIPLRQLSISRYEKEFHEVNLIGKGEFGLVYKCVHRLDGCVYAVKKSLLPVAGSVQEKGAMNEVWANAALGLHPNIVRYYSSWTEDGHVFIQHEYCNGGTLEELVIESKKNESVPCESQLKSILLSVAQGLSFLHTKQIVHLDIKPSNIFMCREYCTSPQLMNFSDADDGFDEVDDETASSTVTYKIGDMGHAASTVHKNVEEGDCRYLPNEVLHEKYSHLTKADIFSLGLTIYEVAGGGPLPKNGDDWHAIRQGKLPYLGHYSPQLHALLELMIHPDPAERPSACDLLQNPYINPLSTKFRLQASKAVNVAHKMADMAV